MSIVANQSWLENQVKETVISDSRTLIAEKISEFKKGQRPDGSLIGRYQDAEYAIFKQQINPMAGGNVDLIFEGGFSKGLVLNATDKGFIFDSTDYKADSLETKYGDEIFGLNQDYFNKRQNDVYRLVLSVNIQKILNK